MTSPEPLKWSKPPGVSISPDISGFLKVNVDVVEGSGLFDPTAIPSGALSMNFSDGAWSTLPGALTTSPISQPFIVVGGKCTPDGDNPKAVTCNIAAKTGLVTGSFTDPDSQGRLRRVTYQAITLTGTGNPEVYGSFIMPSAAVKKPDFYVGGSVIGF